MAIGVVKILSDAVVQLYVQSLENALLVISFLENVLSHMYIVDYCEKGSVVVCIVIVKFKKISNLSSPPPTDGIGSSKGVGGGGLKGQTISRKV